MKAYLDYNIFISLEQGKLKLSDIKGIVSGVKSFPYSAAHIQEVDNITAPNENKREQYIDRRLKTIGHYSDCQYIYHDLKSTNISIIRELPKNVLETIRSVAFAKPAMQMFTSLFSAETKQELRSSMGIDIKQFNNYKPEEVVTHLNERLAMWGDHSFIGIVEQAMSNFPSNQGYGLHNRIAAVYELLDMFGYWKDRKTETSNYARLWDAQHAHYASICDFFISDDLRNRNKAKVVYSLYEIKTKVLSSAGL